MTEKSETAGLEGLDFGESPRTRFGVEPLMDWKLASAKDTFFGEGVFVVWPSDIIAKPGVISFLGLGVSAVLYDTLGGEAPRDMDANLGAGFLEVDLEVGETPAFVGVVKSRERDERLDVIAPLGLGETPSEEKPAKAILGLTWVKDREVGDVVVASPAGGLKVNPGMLIVYRDETLTGRRG